MASVKAQQCNHLIVIDGEIHAQKALTIIKEIDNPNVSVITLPHNTGGDGYLCHRIYASIPMLVNTEFYAHLDEDNLIKPNFVERMQEQIGERHILTCRRTVVRQDLTTIGNDDVESVGPNRFGYYLYDTNTYLVRQDASPRIAPHIYGKWSFDRNLSMVVLTEAKHIDEHLSIYRSPERLYNFFEGICS